MNASSSFRRRFTLFFAALSLAPLLASGAPVSMDFKVLIDVDNRETTGCTVVTTAGLVKGVDHVLTTSVSYDSVAGTAAVTGVTRQTCTDSATNTFSAPIPVDSTGWPVGVSGGGNLLIETHMPMSALGGVVNMHLAFTGNSGSTFADAVMTTPDGNKIIWPPLPGMRRHAVSDAGKRVITLDGNDSDWAGIDPIATGNNTASPRLRFLSVRTYMNANDLFFVIAAQSNANAPTANDDAYSVERGKSIGVAVPGVLSNDTDPNFKPLTAKLVASTQHGALTLNADGSFNYTNDGSNAPSDHFEYKANNGTADSNTAQVNITITEPSVNPPPTPAFTSPDHFTCTVGQPCNFTITTTPANPAVTVSHQSGALPNFVTFSAVPGSGTGHLSGTPASGTQGTYNLTWRATNVVGFADQHFILTVVCALPGTQSASNTGPYCPGNTISLSTSFVAGATYSWTGPNGFTSSLQNPTIPNATTANAGTYSVTVTGNNGCTLATGQTTVVVNPTPATPIASNGGPYCVGGAIALSTPAVAGATYAWTGPNGFTSTLQNPTRANATTADAGTYSVTVTVNSCPSAAGSTNVVVNPIPATPTASNGGPYCEGATIALSTPAVAGATYSWTGPNGFTSTLQNPTRANAALADAGTYSVTVTVSGCTSAAGTTNVVVNATPATPTASNGGPYCPGNTIALSTPSVGGATYSWTGPNGFTSTLQNPTIPSATTANAGTYSVTVTVSGCPSAPGMTNVVVNPTPATPTASNGGPYCVGATISLSTPTVSGASYSWTGPNGFTSTLQNPTRANATTADAGTYSVIITVSGCPSAAGSTNVVVNPIPATPTASNGGPYCEGATIALSTPAVGGATYSWTGPNGFTSSLQNPTIANATVADGGTYSVTVTVSGCTSAAGTTNVVVNATPATPTASNGGPYCEGATISLSTPTVVGATYSWTGPNGFTSTLQNPTVANATTADAGTYSVTVIVSGCPSAAGTTNVVVNTVPATPTASNGGPYCVGATIALSTPTVASATYSWTGPNGFTSTLQNPTRANATLADAGTYSVTVTVNGCTSAAGTTNVVVNANPATPTITPSGPTTFCAGGSVTLTAPGGFTYMWSTGATTQSILVTTSGSYTVTVTDGNGCSAASAPTVVTVNPNPPTPTITPSGPLTFCAGGSVTLTAPGGYSYLWSTTETTQSIIVSSSGSYTVTVTDGNGCSTTSNPVVVTVNPNPPTPTITPSGPTTFCDGGSVTLTAPGGYTYLWSTNETTQSIVVTTSGSFTVTVTDGNGCSATSAATVVTVNPNPSTPTITPSGPTTFCAGGSVTLSAPGGFTYLWSPTNETTQSIVVSSSGSYTVTVTDGNGCSATSAATVVTVNSNPSTPTITPSGPTTFCAGGSVTLNAPGGFTYMWSTGATTQSILVTSSGSYTVTVTDGNGCTATSAPTTVTVNPNPPTPTITPSGSTTFCAGGSVTLNAPSGPYTYSWSTGATTQSILVTTSGSYTVTVTDGNGCSATSAPTTVTVNPNPPTPTITPSGPTTFCAGGSVTLNAPGGYTYLWSTGATTQSILVTTSGSYTVTVTDGNGCSATSAPTTVTVNPNPSAPTITPSPAQVCANSTGNTASGPGGFSYAWSISNGTITSATNIQTITYTAGASGTVGLTLTITDGNGCSASNSGNVTINANPSAPTITPTPAQVCANSTGNTASGPGGFTYSWSIVNGSITSGQTSQTVTYTAGASGTTDLTLTVTNGNGCSASNTVNVTINPSPAPPTITPSASGVCAGSTGNTADGPAGASTYAWSITNGTITSATNIQTITWTAGVAGTTTLTLTVTNANGCPATNSTDVVVNANPGPPTITPTPSPVCPNSTGNTASGPAASTWSWSITNGTITSATNIQTITYTAGASGQVGLTLVVTNASSCSASNSTNVTIASSITPARNGGGSFPAGTVGTAYNGQSFTASGGTAPYTFAVTGGTFPTNLSLASNGTISGTPTATGTFSFTVTATDANNCFGSAVFSIAINPSAVGDSYSNLVNNTEAYVQGGTTTAPTTPAVVLTGSIIGNDLPTGGVAANAGTFATGQGGSVTVAADGTFKYTPPVTASPLASDTFNYTISSNTGGTATPTQATGTVTLNLSGRVWYVKNNGTNGNGQSQSPFNSLSNFTNGARVSPDTSGDIIFVYNGDGTTTNQNAGVALLANEQLIGEGVALVVNGNNLVAAGTKPQITNATAASDGVTLNNGNTVKGVTITGATRDGIAGSAKAGFTADTVTIQNNTASGLHFTSMTGTVTVTNATITNNATGLDINNGTAAISLDNTNSITANAAQRSISIQNRPASAGTIDLGVTVTDNGTGIFVNNNVSGTINFSGNETLSTGTNQAVTVTNNTGATINFSGATTLGITTSTGNGFVATGGGTLTVTKTVNVTTGAAATGVNLNGVIVSGTATFNSINTTNATTGVALTSLGNGNVTINGGTISGGTTGLSLSTLGTSTVTLAGVTITGGVTTGISGTTFGTLSIGSNVSVSGVTALNMTTGNMNGQFLHVSSSGGVNGVSLTSVTGSGTWGCTCAGDTLTGASGATFKVTGGSGGTLSWGSVINQANAADAVNISGSNSGAITFSGNVTTSGTSTGINIAGSSGTYNFTGGASTITGTGGGITIGSNESGTISFGSGYSINGPTTSFTINGSPSVVSAAITYSGTITHNSNGQIFNVTGLSGSLNANNASATAIQGTFNGNGAVTSTFNNVTGTVTINNMSETSGFNTATGTGVAITGTNTGSVFTFNHLVIAATGTTDTMKGLTMVGGGQLAITATGGASSITVGSSALDLNGITLNASTIATVTAAGRGVNTSGILLTNVTGGGAATFSGGTLTGQAGAATFAVSGGTPNVTFSGSITQNAANRAVDVQGTTGGAVSINSVTCGAAATGIHIGDTTQSNGNVTFTTLTLGTSGARMTNQAVTIVNGTGTYSLGTVSIFTSGAKGISLTSASTANTLNVTTGTVDATTSNAITVTGASSATRTTLGVSLTKVSSTSATGNGINVANTNGSFTITGDAGGVNNGSGGTISASSAEGILFNVTGAVSLGYLNVQNSGTKGISVTSGTGFTLDHSNVTDNAGGATDEGVNLINNTGTIAFTNDTVDSAPHNQVFIDNFNTNLTAINASNSTFKCTAGNACQPAGSVGNDAFNVNIRGTSSLTSANVQSCTFSGVRAVGLQVATADTATIGGSSGGVITAPAASHSFVVQTSTFTNNNQQIDFNKSQISNITFQILNNTSMTGSRAQAINAFSSAGSGTGGTITGYINGNQIGTQGTKDSGSAIGNGIRLIVQGDSTQGFFTVDNNIIREVANAHTIELFSQNGRGVSGTGSARFKITNNNLPQPSGTNQSIGCGAGVPCMPDGPLFSLADEHNTTCLLITGNSIYDATTMNAAFDVYIATRTGPPTGAATTIQTGSNGGNSAAAITFINGNNTLTGANKTFDEAGNMTTVASCGSFPP